MNHTFEVASSELAAGDSTQFCLWTKLLFFRHCCQKVLADSVQIVSFFHEWNRLQGSEKSVQLQLAPTLRHQACGNVNFHHHHASPFLPKPFPSYYPSAYFSFDTLALVKIIQSGVGKEVWLCMRNRVGESYFLPIQWENCLGDFLKVYRAKRVCFKG